MISRQLQRSTLLCIIAGLCVIQAASALEQPKDFQNADTNGDGVVNQYEWMSFMRSYFPHLSGGSDEAASSLRGSTQSDPASPEAESAFVDAFVRTLGLIGATEIGDRTFFIAACLAARHLNRAVVFAGAASALAIMHVLSTFVGAVLPALLPRTYTHYASALLFLYFGVRMLNDARTAEDGPSDELLEVEQELVGKKDSDQASSSSSSLNAEEEGLMTTRENGEDGYLGSGASSSVSVSSVGRKDSTSSPSSSKPDHAAMVKIYVQALTLTFLAEWGDRSMIATISISAAADWKGVVLGGLLGHALCTGVAVVGGRMLAAKVSERMVALVGGALFLIFALHAFIVGP